MPVVKSQKEISITPLAGEFILSVLNPEHPIFRLHTHNTTIILSSSFYEFKNRTILPTNAITIDVDKRSAEKLLMAWVNGTQFKRYNQFDIYPEIASLLIQKKIELSVEPLIK